MGNKALKMLLSLCLSISIVGMPTMVSAQDYNQEMGKQAQRDEVALDDNSYNKLSDLYEEVMPVKFSSTQNLNNADRVLDEKVFNITSVLGSYRPYALGENTDPNNAYLAESGNTIQGTLTQTGEMRWYGFIIEETSKIALMVQTVASVDADLYVFQLNQQTYELNLIGGSLTAGAGAEEYCPGVLGAGIYYFAIKSYEGSGDYAFAYYATIPQDMNYEPNDLVLNATEVGVSTTIRGVIDSPFDKDFYKFTLDSPAIMRIPSKVGEYTVELSQGDSDAKVYDISQLDDLYRLDAGTHYYCVYSEDRTYDINQMYNINFDLISYVSADPRSTLFMVNEPTKIVFQCDPGGEHMYVNGHDIDIFYQYADFLENPAGNQQYEIYMYNYDNVRAIIYDVEAADLELPMPTTVHYLNGTDGKGVENMHVLALSLVCPDNFYTIHCKCTGAYVGNSLNLDLCYATVYINPNTGKLVDIGSYNYFYDFIKGSHKLHFVTPYSHLCKYLYPYFNGHEPKVW